jgi:hypothetical protein
MTPELKQDLDELFDDVNLLVEDLHEDHAVPMGTLNISLHNDCNCEKPPLVIETYDDFEVEMSSIVGSFMEDIALAQSAYLANLARLEDETATSGLDDDVLGVIAYKHMTKLV